MSDIKDLTKKINAFVDDRDWEKFQTPKDLAISICLEAAEVLEHFQWKDDENVKKHVVDSKDEIADELADVGIYLIKLADKVDVDLREAIEKKLEKASKKYPVNEVKGDKKLKKYSSIKKKSRNS